MNEIETTFVKPFYLNMMGLNALRMTGKMKTSLINTSRAVTPADVSWMLRTGHWQQPRRSCCRASNA